jgi:hypothetical protein
MQKPPSFKISYLWDYYPIPIHIWHTYSLHNKEKPPKKINPIRFFFIHVKLILKLSIFSWILMEFLIEYKKTLRGFSIKKGKIFLGRKKNTFVMGSRTTLWFPSFPSFLLVFHTPVWCAASISFSFVMSSCPHQAGQFNFWTHWLIIFCVMN